MDEQEIREIARRIRAISNPDQVQAIAQAIDQEHMAQFAFSQGYSRTGRRHHEEANRLWLKAVSLSA